MNDFRSILYQFLYRKEIFILEQRYGLTDPFFRPLMKQRSFQEIARMQGKITCKTIRQIEKTALLRLDSEFCKDALTPQVKYWESKIRSQRGKIFLEDLIRWSDDPFLGGYQAWGVLLIMSRLYKNINNHLMKNLCIKDLEMLKKKEQKKGIGSKKPAPMMADFSLFDIQGSVSEFIKFGIKLQNKYGSEALISIETDDYFKDDYIQINYKKDK